MPDSTSPEPPFDAQAFIGALSQARFDRYLGFADGDEQRAVELYSANVALSQAFYVPLHAVEIALRNRINDCLAPAHGERWFDQDAFKKLEHQGEQLDELYERLATQRLDPSPGQVVSGLTFGYWTQLLSSAYDELWQKELKEIARDDRGKRMTRKALHVPLTNLRNLRNRIAHYEPIITWDLGKRHVMALDVTRWLSPATYRWARTQDTFPAKYAPLQDDVLQVRSAEKARRAARKASSST